MLAKKYRLTKKKDFDRVFVGGQGYYTRFLGIKKTANNLTASRFGIIVSAKVSKKAVLRNRLKRQIRAIIKKHLSLIKPGYDWVIICLPPVLDLPFLELEKNILFIIKKLNGFQANKDNFKNKNK